MINFFDIPSPCYVLEEEKFKKNLEILNLVSENSGAKILLALKGYAFWRSFEIAKEYLSGCCASGIYEALLAYEEFGGRGLKKDICVFSPAYKETEIDKLLSIVTHIIFNSFGQWQKYKDKIKSKNKQLQAIGLSEITIGLRVNPLYSEVSPLIYNTCVPGSRLGITPTEFQKGVQRFGLEEISGLHFHTHCEQNSDALARTLTHFIKYFGNFIPQMKWINFGGGHHITRTDYDVKNLIEIIKNFKANYFDKEIFLEPGEAVGWQSGFLIGEVIDIVQNEIAIAILDVSASAHMPDCLEMPYRPNVKKVSRNKNNNEETIEIDKGEGVGKYTYRFGGPTCLAGDVIGDYSFETPLNIKDRIIFEDMMHYTIVKNNIFNGVPLPAFGKISEKKSDKTNNFTLLKTFGYADYKNRN